MITLYKRISMPHIKLFNSIKDQWIVVAICTLVSLVLFVNILRHTSNYHQKNQMLQLNLQDSHLLTLDEVENIESFYTNLPLSYWIQVKKQTKRYRKNSTCAHFPNLLELDLTHGFWQSVRFSNATLQLLNAYYDAREVTPGMNIRIPCMIDRAEVHFESFCHFWFDDDEEPVIVKVEQIHYMWYAAWHMHIDYQYGPYLIECKIPESHKNLIPRAVSIVENPCDNAKNLMKVQYVPIPEEKKNFTVCVKGLDFLQVDLSARLVEWLEFIFLMGVDKVHLYNLEMHPNMRKVLNYYESLGKVDVRQITLPEGQINFPVLQHLYIKNHGGQQCLDEIIPYNDCFYRNIHLYKYVALLDIDEVIIPQLDDDWDGLMTRVLNHSKPGEQFASFNARNVYFLDDMTPEGTYDDIPPYMHMLQHVYRSVNFTNPGCYVKSFFNTDHVIACHNHLPFHFSPKSLYSFDIHTDEAHMQHYRTNCVGELDCNIYRNHIVKDAGMWKYKEAMIKNTNKVLEAVGLLV